MADVQAVTVQGTARARQTAHQGTPPRVPLWETQMTPHGHRPASRTDFHVAEDSAALPTVGPSTEVNALGQPLQVKICLEPVVHLASLTL